MPPWRWGEVLTRSRVRSARPSRETHAPAPRPDGQLTGGEGSWRGGWFPALAATLEARTSHLSLVHPAEAPLLGLSGTAHPRRAAHGRTP